MRWGELRALGLIATALGSSGCTTEHVSQAVHPSELPRIAQDYRDGFVRLRDGRSVPVQNLDEAQVELHAPCATWREEITRTRCGDVSVELSELGTDANQLTPSQTEPWAMRGLRVSDVDSAQLELEISTAPVAKQAGTGPSEKRMPSAPTFGVGFTLFGPAIFGAFSGQWYAANWLVLELGLLGGGGFDAFAGFKLRPGPSARSRIWFGAAIGGFCGEGLEEPEGTQDASTGDPPADQPEPAIVLGCVTAATLRIGLDWTWDRGRWQVSPEVDLLIPTDSETDRTIGPWAGVSVSRLF
ncbi:MAG: hypothetical protein R3B07_26975 [Polyangiaceae bacterium]